MPVIPCCCEGPMSLHFPVMTGSVKGSVASTVANAVGFLPVHSFVRAGDFNAPRGAVDTALSRLCASGGLVRVRRGLYWKGVATRFGMSLPSVEETALEVGGPGSGPAGVAAAHRLGVTTQVPAVFAAAVPGRAPKGWAAVRFSQRPASRRLRGLRPVEVALAEVLRAGPAVVERPWAAAAAAVGSLVDRGELRPLLLDQQIRDEPHRQARQRWSDLVASVPQLAAGVAV